MTTLRILSAAPPEAIGYGGLALGLLLLLLCLRAGRRKRLIDNLPTCKTTGVFIGLVELKGTAEAESPLQSYLAAIPCVYYAWSVEEHWSRTVTETYKDSQGRTQTRTRHESGWSTVASGGERTLFYLRDDCGLIRVNPERAEIQAPGVFSREVGIGDPLYYGKGPAVGVMHSDQRRRFVEHAIPLHAMLYLVGRARLREDVVAPEIAWDRDAPMFLISTRSEQRISTGLAVQYWVLGVLGVAAAVGGWAAVDHMQRVARPAVGHYVWIGAGGLGAWLLGWVWMVYNSMQDLRQRVRQGWANVDVQLKRRADLIPSLVEVVKGYSGHEQRTLEEVTLLRSQAQVTAPGQPGPDPRGCLASVVALREAYPELKANEQFGKLQAALADTEQRIALAREYFNNIAEFYNARLQVVPDRFVCMLASMKPQPFISAEGFERAAVRVNLSDAPRPPSGGS
ncbi:MAG: hypothetical protein BIFFINMI_01085 [Phycisphaerae bacterium]|nr:hypothetical protein [Phycisphaerae bacterium]